jgi:hypothetical protein
MSAFVDSLRKIDDTGRWSDGSYYGAASKSKKYADVDTLWIMHCTNAACTTYDTLCYYVAWHIGGTAGGPSDSSKSFEK